MMEKIAFATLGCKLNYAETSTYERGFAAAGMEVVGWDSPADIYLINTCAVTEHAEKKSRNLIRRAHRLSPGAAIIVTGCSAHLRKDEISALEGVSRVFGTGEKSLVVPETLSLVRGTTFKADVMDTFPAYSSGERTRSFLKVQDGCNNFCSYCTVPFARGRSRNIPVCEAVRLAREIASKGIREIVLTGVNTGDFGRSTGESFLSLLQALDGVEGIERYRISSIEPNLITEEVVDWIASGTKFLPHFHIPLQSGSDTVLATARRKYDTALFASRIDYIRSRMERPGSLKVFFGIDVIAGLPGETDELFMETYNFLEQRIKPAFIHVFPYSRRPGTAAASMPGQVREQVKTERVRKLEELCASLNSQFVEANRGLKARVLWESSDHGGVMSGFTENYIRVERPYDPALSGQITEVTI
ncbi:MAG: tRNA (N(6)-L-threonylcarbamoyladenosine(37)-C(2))-methylthiotransferase MtaB [Bacteroidales bacterium]|nr:tRNA (N(6)-L-threonylcarbamoyladenosine(37)-C(2))-methylthiotransferase MtaB [Bacteroidales bacterium]